MTGFVHEGPFSMWGLDIDKLLVPAVVTIGLSQIPIVKEDGQPAGRSGQA